MATPKAKLLSDGTLMLFGVIGDEWDGLNSSAIVSEIRSLGAPDILPVLINSPGGDVAEGLAIYNELATTPARVEVEISGVAASMASVIAMAGDVIRIARNSHVMIHDPWMVGVGNAEELRKAAELLDQFGTSLVDIYATRTGLPEDEIREMMAEETWMTAEEAVEKGFADEVIEPVGAGAFADLDVSGLRRVPGKLVALIQEANMAKTGKDKDTPTPEGGNEPHGQGAEAAADPKVVAEEAVRAERKRAGEIRALADRHNLGATWANARIDGGDTVEAARTAALEALAERQSSGPSGVPAGTGVTADVRDKWMAGMEAWLFVKSGNARLIEEHTGTKPEAGEFRGMRLVDIARDALENDGHRTRGMAPLDIAGSALRGGPRASSAGLGTRSDFPLLLENVLHKMLLAAYETAPDQWRQVAATGSVSDFRDHPRYRLGSLPRLSTLLESGEFAQMHFPDAEKEVIRADTFGNLIGLTRQAIVNDDMDGFARLVTMIGRAAARSIEIDLFALFGLNSGLGPTLRSGDTLFHANHSNIASTAGTPSVATLEAARVLMAQQKDSNDNDFLNLRPAVWVGPIGLGAAARTAVNAEFDFDAETSGNSGKFMKPNVVRDLLSTIVDTPRLSGDRWYVLASPDVAPVFEVVFLEGQESPVIETEEGFDYDGIRWRVRHDYGVGATDFRGAVTNAGA